MRTTRNKSLVAQNNNTLSHSELSNSITSMLINHNGILNFVYKKFAKGSELQEYMTTDVKNNQDMQAYVYRGGDSERAPEATTEAVIIHASVTVIKRCAFKNCTYLKKVFMMDNVTRIELEAFDGCKELEFVSLSRRLECIEAYAFYGCSSLEALFLPRSIKQINEWAFGECKSLRFFDLPAPSVDIGDEVIYGATDLLCHSNIEYIEKGGIIINDYEVNQWLQHRFDAFPLLRLCYRDIITIQDINDCIREHGIQATVLADERGMIPMHIIAANPYASAEIITACYHANPETVHAIDKYGSTPIHYLCKYHPNLLKEMDWLSGCIYCFHISNNDEITPLQTLAVHKNIQFLPLPIAINLNLSWSDGMNQIVETNVESYGHQLENKDPDSGLYYFILAAAARKSAGTSTKNCCDLSTIYELLRFYPDQCSKDYPKYPS